MSSTLVLPMPVGMMFEGTTSPCTISSRCRADGTDGPSRSTAMPISGFRRGWIAPAVMITPLS
jgi:hypothetical protein